MTAPNWAPISRHYEIEASKISMKRTKLTAMDAHPLLPNRVRKVSNGKGRVEEGKVNKKSDPLSGTVVDPLMDPLNAGGGFIDPLSDAANKLVINDPLANPPSVSTAATYFDPLSSNSGSTGAQETKQQILENSRQMAEELHNSSLHTTWEKKKQQILRDYTVSGNITLNSSAIVEFAGSGVEDGSDTRHLDKYTQRLASLERRQIKEEKVELTQKEYQSHISKLSDDLSRAWKNDERVGSLKIAIQLAKLLADTTVPMFYPSIFVMVTQVLDNFGNMVFNRLRSKADESLREGSASHRAQQSGLSDHFTSADVPNIAKDTTRNWFYKTACIRELLPRIYVEIALFKCYRFVTETDFAPILSRIGSIIRGIGDPLVAVYVRMYLVVTGSNTIPHLTSHAQSMLQDILFTSSVLRDSHMASEFQRCSLTAAQYHRLLSPAIEWIVNCVGRSASKEVFQSVLQMYRDHCNDATVLKHIIISFDSSHYAHGALGMAALIKGSNASYATPTEVYIALARQLMIHPPPEEHRLPLLNDVWKVVSKAASSDFVQYVKCTAVWLDLVQRYYTEREMFVLMSNLAQRLGETFNVDNNRSTDIPEAVLTELEQLLTTLIGQSSAPFGTAVLTSEHLLKILDAFKGPKKVALCKDIIESFKSQPATNDAVLINTLFDLCRIIHDSVDMLSPVADVSYIADLLCSFVDKINFGRDLEQQLNFYVECRAAFCNLDHVKDKLIVCVSCLAMRALRIMKGKHSKKTATFVKACLAYCHITIPSLSDAFRKLELLLLCAQTALVNQCLPQTDTFLKAAISLLPEVPSHYENEDNKRVNSEDRLGSYIMSLLSFLLVTPGHPEHGPFYIIHGLINALPRYQWQPTGVIQPRIYINILSLLCTLAQKKFPYHISGVQSNDELYGGAPSYMGELEEQINVCLAEVLKQLTALGERPEASAKLNRARVTIELVNTIAARMDLDGPVASYVMKLTELAHKEKGLFTRNDARFFTNTVEFVIKQLQSKVGPSAKVSSDYPYTVIDTLRSFVAVETR